MQHHERYLSRSDASSRVWFAGYGPKCDALTTFTKEDHDSDSPVDNDYREQLPTPELLTEVRRLLGSQRHSERLICRYLADLADRIRARQHAELDAYVDEFHAARCFVQLGVRDTRERVRIGRALRQLPEIERAFVDGELSYSRVREVTRVATPETERDWLLLAEQVDMRALERRVVAAREPSGEARDHAREPTNAVHRLDTPMHAEWTTPKTVRVTFELSAESWALVERALAGARRLAEDTLNDSEALEAVARDALSSQNAPADASDPRCSVVIYSCKRCGTSELDTGSGTLELDPASFAATACGTTTIDLEHEGRNATRGGPLPAAVRRAVMLRDRCTCRVPGCNRRRYVDVHHVTPQANGGEHSRENCIVLCTTHHRLLHEGKLQITGDADRFLDVRDSSGIAVIEPQRWSDFEWASSGATEGTTQGGSSAAARLLQIMGRRGGWTADALIEASGLPASTVSSTLLVLELDGRVRNRELSFDPL